MTARVLALSPWRLLCVPFTDALRARDKINESCSAGFRRTEVKRIARGKLLGGVLVLAFLARAQTSRGTVTGTVLDPSGAVLAGAHVTLNGVQTGVRFSTDSNNAGVYRFDAVDPGVYDLSVTHSGFRTYLGTRIGVEANRGTTVDPRLEVGTAEARIEVS